MENLSPELTRNFKLIYELDTRVHEILLDIDRLKSDYLTNFAAFDVDKRQEKMREIDAKYDKCKQFSEEKVQLANLTYDLVSATCNSCFEVKLQYLPLFAPIFQVDKHIRRLDTDLAKFEAELKERTQLKSTDGEANATELNSTVVGGGNMKNLNSSMSTMNTSLNTTHGGKRTSPCTCSLLLYSAKLIGNIVLHQRRANLATRRGETTHNNSSNNSRPS